MLASFEREPTGSITRLDTYILTIKRLPNATKSVTQQEIHGEGSECMQKGKN
jgi:hypothetical protein